MGNVNLSCLYFFCVFFILFILRKAKSLLIPWVMKRMNQVAKGESKEKRKKKKSPDKNIAQPARVSLICSFIFHFTCTSAWVRAAAAAGKRWCRRGSSLNLRREAPTNEKRGNIKWILFCIWATFNQMSFHQIDNYNYYFPIRLPFREGREVKWREGGVSEKEPRTDHHLHTHTLSRGSLTFGCGVRAFFPPLPRGVSLTDLMSVRD